MITTTVSWDDLIHAYDDELADLRDAYDEIEALATDEYGEDALERPATEDTLQVYQTQAAQYDEAAKSIQKRQNVLERLRDEYGEGEFEIKMLSGEETMQIETELRRLAQSQDVSVDVVQVKRNALTVDMATVDAPEGVPSDEDGPTPSQAPNALTLSLWEHIEAFNNAGETGFTAGGFGSGDRATSPTVVQSATPTNASEPSKSSDPSGE